VLVILGVGALSASLALLMAHLRYPLLADLLAVIAAGSGLVAFALAARFTLHRGRPHRSGSPRP
jgi:hypothetical protein